MKKRRFITETESEARNIAKRIKERDFSGNTGAAIKNSTWSLAQVFSLKIGSLLFTIVIARLLMPELFGLYSLALSTIFIISAFTEFGIRNTITTFVSRNISSSKGKAKGYFLFLTKMRILLLFLGSMFLLISAKYFADVIYRKPIFYALLAGVIYFPALTLSNYLGVVFRSNNNFKIDFIGEVVYQVSRLIIVPLTIMTVIYYSLSNELTLMYIFLALSLSYLLTGAYYLYVYLKYSPFKHVSEKRVSKKEKYELFLFALPLAITGASGFFFNNIDTIMLGRYVGANYVGYYNAAFSLISSFMSVVTAAVNSIFPIFARLKNQKLQRGFRRARSITLLFSSMIFIMVFITAPYFVYLVFGEEYAQAVPLLRVVSILLISFPVASLYQAYFISQKRTRAFSILLIISTFLNILLNFIFIRTGAQYGMYEATMGACLATIISRYAYLLSLGIYKKIAEKKH